MPSLMLSIAGKIAIMHMNSTLSGIFDICIMDFRTRCYGIFSVVNIFQCSYFYFFFLEKVFPLFLKIIFNIYFLKIHKNCFLIQVKYQRRILKFSFEIMSTCSFLLPDQFILPSKRINNIKNVLQIKRFIYLFLKSNSGSMLKTV